MHISVSPAVLSWNLNFPLMGEGGASAGQGLGQSQNEGGGEQLWMGDQMLRLGPALLLLGRHLGCVSVYVCMHVLCFWLHPPASCASPRSTEGSHFPGEAELPFRRSVWTLYPTGKFGFQRRDSQSGQSEGLSLSQGYP